MTTIWGRHKFDWLGSGPHGSRRFANGGWTKSASIFGEKNGEPEVAINPKRSSADRLLMQAIAKRIREAPSSIFGKLFNSSKRQKEIEDIKNFSPDNFRIAPTSKKPAKVTEQKAVAKS